MSKNYPTFRKFLRGAICTRTQAQFANESGISTVHLNRMLNNETIYRPKRETLQKIAAAAQNGITYQDLENALNQDDPELAPQDEERIASAKEDFMPDFKELAEQTMDSLVDAISARAYPVMTSSLSNHIDELLEETKAKKHDNLDIAYEMGVCRQYFGVTEQYASKYVSVGLTMADSKNTASSLLIMYYMEVPSENGPTYAIQKVDVSVKAVMDLYGLPPAALEKHKSNEDSDEGYAVDAALQDPYYLDFEPVERFIERYTDPDAKTDEEKIISSLLGKEVHYSETLEGFGFWLEAVPQNFPKFVKNHEKSILNGYLDQPENYDALKEIMDSIQPDDEPKSAADKFDAFEYYYKYECCEGWQAVISTVMHHETGFYFMALKHTESNDFPNLSDQDCIIITDDQANKEGIRRETLILVACRYAKELGIRLFGDIMFTHVATSFRKPHTYAVRMDEETSENENVGFFDQEYSAEIGKDQPEETGMYAVLLKDGRRIRCLFVKSRNAWIFRHMEWSHMIKAYCPKMLPVPNRNEQS